MKLQIAVSFSILLLAAMPPAEALASGEKALSAAASVRLPSSHAREKNTLAAPIKSRADLTAHMSSTESGKSPIELLSKAAKEQFLASLTFNKLGLTSFNFGVLERELTPTQIFQVLSLFGVQDLTGSFKQARVVTKADQQILDDFVEDK